MAPPPRDIVWDLTYACPLRCVHCYSESGRRPSRQLGHEDLERVVDALVSLAPRAIVFSGGEPLIVPGIVELAQRVAQAGVQPHLYTSGWVLRPQVMRPMLDAVSKVTVSVDGATAATHDRIRGRVGSFERAMAALAWLDNAIGGRRRVGGDTPSLGVDFVVVRSNLHELVGFCSLVGSRFANVDYLFFGAVLPIGLASRAGFARQELLTERQADLLRSEGLAQRLRQVSPATTEVQLSDNGMFQMHPDRLAAGEIPAMQVEPDGRVRAMPVYEGTVGSLLDEDPLVLWERAVQRWSDPLVTRLLRSASGPESWAAATRQIDLRFGTAVDRDRISRRPPYPAASRPDSERT
jgi:MoaA/NifB/PqqE/SkfB family radical SAM enzyme